MVHTVAFAWFARVWLWHLTPAAAGLPGAQGFGWFIRFLTFWSFTLQTFTLGLATADDWSKLVRCGSGDVGARARVVGARAGARARAAACSLVVAAAAAAVVVAAAVLAAGRLAALRPSRHPPAAAPQAPRAPLRPARPPALPRPLTRAPRS